MAIEYLIKNIKCVEFNSIIDNLDYILAHTKNNKYGIIDEIKSNIGWNGKYTLDETINGMKYGFQDQTDYFLNLISEVRVQEDLGDGTYMDTEGYAYDMGSVVNGTPECCINSKLPSIVPCVKILVDISFNCGITPKELNNRGIAVTNLINTLIINGFIIDLHYFMYNHQSDKDVMFTLKINTEVLPISTIAFISSVDYFRKIGFITMDVIRNKKSEIGRGCSSMQDFMLNKIKKDKIFFIGGSYSDSELYKHLSSPQSATKYLLKSFKLYCEKNKIMINLKNNDIDNKNTTKKGNKK